MKITTVSYNKTFPTAPYANEKIGFEAQIEDGDDAENVVNSLKALCELIHRQNNPHLYQEQETTIGINQKMENDFIYSLQNTEKTSQPIDNPPKKLSQKELITQELNLATSITQVTQWKLLADKFPETKELYEQKINELTK